MSDQEVADLREQVAEATRVAHSAAQAAVQALTAAAAARSRADAALDALSGTQAAADRVASLVDRVKTVLAAAGLGTDIEALAVEAAALLSEDGGGA